MGKPSTPPRLPVHTGAINATGEVAQGILAPERRACARVRLSEHVASPPTPRPGLACGRWAEVTSGADCQRLGRQVHQVPRTHAGLLSQP